MNLCNKAAEPPVGISPVKDVITTTLECIGFQQKPISFIRCEELRLEKSVNRTGL
jgi:hypothetical protein